MEKILLSEKFIVVGTVSDIAFLKPKLIENHCLSNFTLDNKIKGALNFYSYDGILILNTPIKLSIMSMPPTENGITTYYKGDNIEISGTNLIKVNSTNFVISNIKTK